MAVNTEHDSHQHSRREKLYLLCLQVFIDDYVLRWRCSQLFWNIDFLCVLRLVVHLDVILCVPFVIALVMTMRTFVSATFMLGFNVPFKKPLQICFIVTMSAVEIFHHRAMLSCHVKPQRGTTCKIHVANVASLLDLFVNCNVMPFHCRLSIPCFVLRLEIAE